MPRDASAAVPASGVAIAIAFAGMSLVVACAPPPPYADQPAPESAASPPTDTIPSRAVAAGAVEAVTSVTGSGACGRLLALRSYRNRLGALIADIEKDGVTGAERTDLMRATSRLHAVEADMATAAHDVAAARYRLEALTGGRLRASDLPACAPDPAGGITPDRR